MPNLVHSLQVTVDLPLSGNVNRQQQVTHLVIVGMMTHMCVDATARAAKDLGFACTLIHDATATRELTFAGHRVPASQVQTAFIAALSTICNAVQSSAEIVRALSETAE